MGIRHDKRNTLGNRFNVIRLKSICVISHKNHYRSRLYRTRVTGKHMFNFAVSEMKITELYAFSVFKDFKLCTKIIMWLIWYLKSIVVGLCHHDLLFRHGVNIHGIDSIKKT